LSTIHVSSTSLSTSHHSLTKEEKGRAESANVQPLLPHPYRLPFHQSIFEDVPFANRCLFSLWICSVGPIVLMFRLIIILFAISIKGPAVLLKRWMFTGVISYWIEVEGAGAVTELKDDGRPVVFLTNHHITYDLYCVLYANQMCLSQSSKIIIRKYMLFVYERASSGNNPA
jgi:hypothetical protein